MSSISIYQSVSDLNDSQLETLVSDCQNIISRGKRAAVELCIKMAETDDYLNTLKKKDKKAKLSMIIDKLDIKSVTFYKYAKVGRHVKDNPALQDMSMDAIIAKMRPQKLLAAPTQNSTKVNVKSEYARLSGFVEFLRKRMGDDTFNNLYDKYEAAEMKKGNSC